MEKTILLIRQEFHKALQTRTSWGRNQVKEVFERSVTNALAIRLGEELPPIDGKAGLEDKIEQLNFTFEEPKKEYENHAENVEDFFDDLDPDEEPPW